MDMSFVKLLLLLMFLVTGCQTDSPKEIDTKKPIPINHLTGRYIGQIGDANIDFLISKIDKNKIIGQNREFVNNQYNTKEFEGIFDSTDNSLVLYENFENKNSGIFEGKVILKGGKIIGNWRSHKEEVKFSWEVKKVDLKTELPSLEIRRDNLDPESLKNSGNSKVSKINTESIKKTLISSSGWKNKNDDLYFFSEQAGKSYQKINYTGSHSTTIYKKGIHHNPINPKYRKCDCTIGFEWNLTGNNINITTNEVNCRCQKNNDNEWFRDKGKEHFFKNNKNYKIEVNSNSNININGVIFKH